MTAAVAPGTAGVCVYCAGTIYAGTVQTQVGPETRWHHQASGATRCPDGATTEAAPIEVVDITREDLGLTEVDELAPAGMTGNLLDNPGMTVQQDVTGTTRYVGHDPQVVASFDEQGPPARPDVPPIQMWEPLRKAWVDLTDAWRAALAAARTDRLAAAESGGNAPAPRGGDTPPVTPRATGQVVHWSDGPDADHVRAVFREIPPRAWDATIHRTDAVDTYSHGTVDSADAHALIAAIVAAHRTVTARGPVPTDMDALPRMYLPPGGAIVQTVDGWMTILPFDAVEPAGPLVAGPPDPSLFDRRPHSRACGIVEHPHGARCHPNCPTCHGKVEL